MKKAYVVLTILTAIILLTVSLHNDFFVVSDRVDRQGDEFATVSFMSNSVKRRAGDTFIWEDVKVKSPLFLHDSIVTLDDSEAKVTFKSGNEIELGPNSLVMLENVDDEYLIKFVRGNIFTKAQESGLKVRVGKKNIILKSSSSFIAKDMVQVFSGAVKVDNREVKPVATKFSKMSPALNSRILTSKKFQKVNFSWRRKGRGAVEVEIAKNYQFKKIFKVKKIYRGNRTNFTLKEGIYYYRLKSGKSLSNVYKFSVVNESQTSVVEPLMKQKFKYISAPDPIKFRWTASSIQERFKYELASERKFKKILQSGDSDKRQVFMSLPSGKYFFRVKSYNRYRKKPLISKTVRFQVVKVDRLDPPKLLKPIKDTVFFIKTMKKRGHSFSWQVVPGVKQYEFLLAGDKEFKKLFEKKTVSGTQYSIPSLSAGVYYWTIRAVGGEKSIKSQGSPERFQVVDEPLIKILEPSDKFTLRLMGKKNETISFKWVEGESKRYYKIFISKDPDFLSQVRSIKVRKPEYELKKLTPGQYYWKVSEYNKNHMVTNISGAREFQITNYEFTPPPALVNPKNNKKFEYFAGEKLQFRWGREGDAKAYLFRLIRVKKGGKKVLILSKKMKSTTFQIKMPNRGKYLWEVKSIDEEGVLSRRARSRNFRVVSEKKLKLEDDHKIEIR